MRSRTHHDHPNDKKKPLHNFCLNSCFLGHDTELLGNVPMLCYNSTFGNYAVIKPALQVWDTVQLIKDREKKFTTKD